MEIKIPQSIIDYLTSYGITDYNIIEVNPRKGRYCLKCRLSNECFFLKWNEIDKEFRYYLESLMEEYAIYKGLDDLGITPRLIRNYESPNSFCTAFIENSSTLRTRLKELVYDQSTADIYDIITRVLDKWQKMIINLTEKKLSCKDQHIKETYFLYMGSLLCSGPLGTKGSKIEHLRNAIYNRVHRYFLSRSITNRLTILTKSSKYVIHGDFHANNVLLDNDDRTYIIDFENIKYGLPEVELAYMYAQICLLIRDKNDLLTKLDSYIDNNIHIIKDKKLYWELFEIYYKSIKMNRRFY